MAPKYHTPPKPPCPGRLFRNALKEHPMKKWIVTYDCLPFETRWVLVRRWAAAAGLKVFSNRSRKNSGRDRGPIVSHKLVKSPDDVCGYCKHPRAAHAKGIYCTQCRVAKTQRLTCWHFRRGPIDDIRAYELRRRFQETQSRKRLRARKRLARAG